MTDLFDLTGKVALITGGTQGIGLAIGLLLGKAGAIVCVNGRNNEKLQICKDVFKAHDLDIFTLKFDVTDESDVDKGVSMIERVQDLLTYL